MGILMLGELVRRRLFSGVWVALGSLLLASCSSNTTRFDFPTFGLAKSENGGSTGVTLNSAARLGEDNSSGYIRGGSSIAEFERDQNPDLAYGSGPTASQRNSYMPPQTALPEVRGARYGAIERNRLPSNSGGLRDSRPANVAAYQPAAVNQVPMKPMDDARRSFLPSEPPGYAYAPSGYQNAAASRQASLNVDAARPSAGAMRTKSAQAPAKPQVPNAGGEITVQQGDTMYAISQRHGVSVVEMMEYNNLADSNISKGQRLRIPESASVRSSTTAARAAAPAHSASSGTYTVKIGDDFQSIARDAGVDAAELADLNGITDTAGIRPGEVLILPIRGRNAGSSAVEHSTDMAAETSDDDNQGQKVHKVRTVRVASLPPEGDVVADAASEEAATEVTEPQKANGNRTISGFRWPVDGRIIEKFGQRVDGSHNDGINLAVPIGTKVKAAEDGIVAYSGSELKDYGNLVLIRHADGWVSAYAHNDEILVQRGDQVKRGQDIARAGKSGSVSQPQVHFELRKGSKPVDPTKYMAGS